MDIYDQIRNEINKLDPIITLPYFDEFEPKKRLDSIQSGQIAEYLRHFLTNCPTDAAFASVLKIVGTKPFQDWKNNWYYDKYLKNHPELTKERPQPNILSNAIGQIGQTGQNSLICCSTGNDSTAAQSIFNKLFEKPITHYRFHLLTKEEKDLLMMNITFSSAENKIFIQRCDGRNLSQIAEIMHCSVSTVKNYHRSMLAKIKEFIIKSC